MPSETTFHIGLRTSRAIGINGKQCKSLKPVRRRHQAESHLAAVPADRPVRAIRLHQIHHPDRPDRPQVVVPVDSEWAAVAVACPAGAISQSDRGHQAGMSGEQVRASELPHLHPTNRQAVWVWVAISPDADHKAKPPAVEDPQTGNRATSII